MTIIKPEKLKKGDTIGIIAVSGKIKEPEKIENAKKFFEKEGYNVVISDSCSHSHRYMAGKSDEECINTLHDFFSDSSINAILCARGGYGTLRLIDKIDKNLIKKNPKIFAGYSDITVLLNMIYKETGLITFHSAMPNGDFSTEINEYTKKSFFDTLSGEKKEYKADEFEIYGKNDNIKPVKGRLFGGNLSTLASMCGTDFIPDDDLILFTEDLNEPVYKIDRMFTQLFNVEKIRKRVKGIICGDFQGVNDSEELKEILDELSNKIEIPVCRGFKITHDKTKDTIPVGVEALFDPNKGTINLTETYTK